MLNQDYEAIIPKQKYCCQNLHIPQRYIMSYRSNFKSIWDIFVLVLAVYNSMQVPYEHAFRPEVMNHIVFKTTNTVIDVVFVVDIILMFLTSVISKKGVETFDASIIANQYVTQPRFYADCLSILGSGVFTQINRFFSLFGLFKVMRVFRIGPIISKSNVNKQVKALMNVIKIIFFLYFYLHCLACYMWLAVDFKSPMRYYRDYNTNSYNDYQGNPLLDDAGNSVPLDENFYVMFGTPQTFKDDAWTRFTADDNPDWESLNTNWESRESMWYLPLDWVNYVDQKLFTKYMT